MTDSPAAPSAPEAAAETNQVRSRTSDAHTLTETGSSGQQLQHKPVRPVTFARIRWAPLTIPKERRLQTAAVATLGTLMATSLALFLFLCSIPLFWPPIIAYIVWMHFIDDGPTTGKRRSQRIRQSDFFKYFADYFPISLVKTTDLPADRTYIFGSHPHGIISVGALANFASEATGFSQLFPGLKPHLLTLTANFMLPGYRDVILALGICSVSRRSCQTILRSGAGNCITIVVGGAAESLAATPGTADLTLKRRLGFIKLAVREGADLVPCFSFGENDIFDQLAGRKDSKLRSLQKRFQATFGFTLPIFFGRGLLNYSAGLMPFRHPIVTVVGKPIRVEQDANPSQETLERYQELYIAELMRIWEEHKEELAPHRKKDLNIVD